MNSQILNAILSMDAYNRGYNATIKFGNLPDNSDSETVGLMLGGVSIVATRGQIDAQNVGFYAIAYKDTFTGKTIISYRGTDDPSGLVSGGDVINGWIGVSGVQTTQAGMAFSFYNDVAKALNNGTGIDPRTANISLTGHSLGGGLAGLVGAVYGKTGYLFDNMPFEQAAKNTQTHSDQLIALSKGTFYDASLKALVYKDYNGGKTWAPMISSASSIQTYYAEGEILESLRFAQETHKNPLTLGKNVEIPDASPLFSTAVALHSMPILVTAIYGDPSNTAGMQTDWQNAGKYFWPVLFDKEFAGEFVPAGKVAGTADTTGHYETILQMTIAYSAIDEGPATARPFGDTAIKSFFNDANDLGKAAGPDAQKTPSAITAWGGDIAKAFVQYAGELALNKIAQTALNTAVLAGVLSYAGAANNHTLTVDYSDATWKASGLAITQGSNLMDIAARNDMVNRQASPRLPDYSRTEVI